MHARPAPAEWYGSRHWWVLRLSVLAVGEIRPLVAQSVVPPAHYEDPSTNVARRSNLSLTRLSPRQLPPQHLPPSILTVCPPILIVSLSPRSVSSWIRSSGSMCQLPVITPAHYRARRASRASRASTDCRYPLPSSLAPRSTSRNWQPPGRAVQQPARQGLTEALTAYLESLAVSALSQQSGRADRLESSSGLASQSARRSGGQRGRPGIGEAAHTIKGNLRGTEEVSIRHKRHWREGLWDEYTWIGFRCRSDVLFLSSECPRRIRGCWPGAAAIDWSLGRKDGPTRLCPTKKPDV